jgi:hypothetical protein
MTAMLRGHPAEEMLRLVSLNEDLWLPRAIESPRNSTYRKVHNWLLREDYLTRLILRTGGEAPLPGLKIGRAALLWRRFLGAPLRGSCAADGLRVKTNLRAFYPRLSTPTVTKVLLVDGPNASRKLQSEVEARSQVSRFGCVMTPRLLKYDFKQANPWYAEQLIVGRTSLASDTRLVTEKLLPGLMKMYDRFGVVWQAPARNLAADWHETLKRAVGGITWQSQWLPPAEFLDRVLRLTRDSSALPCSTGHGDLSPSNLIVTQDGSICVIDWEHAGLRPIVFDLAPLIAAFPGIEQAIATHIAGIKAPSVALPFREQCLLAIAAQIVASPHHEGRHQTSNWQAKRLQSRLSQLFHAVRHAPAA